MDHKIIKMALSTMRFQAMLNATLLNHFTNDKSQQKEERRQIETSKGDLYSFVMPNGDTILVDPKTASQLDSMIGTFLTKMNCKVLHPDGTMSHVYHPCDVKYYVPMDR